MYRINVNFKQVGGYGFCHHTEKFEKKEHCKDCCNIVLNKNINKRHKCKKNNIYVKKIDCCEDWLGEVRYFQFR